MVSHNYIFISLDRAALIIYTNVHIIIKIMMSLYIIGK